MADRGTHGKRVPKVYGSNGATQGLLSGVQQRVEPAGPVERHQFITTADMAAVDEDLRHRGAPARAADRVATLSRAVRCVDLAEVDALAVQQADGAGTEGAPGLCVDLDLGHSSLPPEAAYAGVAMTVGIARRKGLAG